MLEQRAQMLVCIVIAGAAAGAESSRCPECTTLEPRDTPWGPISRRVVISLKTAGSSSYHRRPGARGSGRIPLSSRCWGHVPSMLAATSQCVYGSTGH